jgi:hypothetical protein
MATRFKSTRPVMGTPDQGTSAKDMLAKAVGKESGDDLTLDDVRTLTQRSNMSSRDARRTVKGAKHLINSGNEYRMMTPGTYNVFKGDTPEDRSSRQAGNRVGKDFMGDTLKAGRNVGLAVGLAQTLQPEKKAEQTTSTGTTIEGTPAAVGTTIDNWWKTGSTVDQTKTKTKTTTGGETWTPDPTKKLPESVAAPEKKDPSLQDMLFPNNIAPGGGYSMNRGSDFANRFLGSMHSVVGAVGSGILGVADATGGYNPESPVAMGAKWMKDQGEKYSKERRSQTDSSYDDDTIYNLAADSPEYATTARALGLTQIGNAIYNKAGAPIAKVIGKKITPYGKAALNVVSKKVNRIADQINIKTKDLVQKQLPAGSEKVQKLLTQKAGESNNMFRKITTWGEDMASRARKNYDDLIGAMDDEMVNAPWMKRKGGVIKAGGGVKMIPAPAKTGLPVDMNAINPQGSTLWSPGRAALSQWADNNLKSIGSTIKPPVFNPVKVAQTTTPGAGPGAYGTGTPEGYNPFGEGSKALDVVGTVGKYALPFIGEAMRRKAWKDVAPVKFTPANYLTGTVRDLPMPNLNLRARNPVGPDVQSEITGMKFGDAQQRDAGANYQIQNAMSKLEQENQIKARTNEGLARNQAGRLQTDMMNAQLSVNKAQAMGDSYAEPFVAGQQHLNQDMSSRAYLDYAKKSGLAEQILKTGNTKDPMYNYALKWLNAKQGGKLKV